MQQRHLLAIVVPLACLSWAANALAYEPFTQGRVQLALGLDYGLYLGESIEGVPTPYGLGINVRTGYTMAPSVYLGGEFNYFFGSSQRFPEYGDVEGTLSIVHAGAEIGYDISMGQAFVFRPKVGVGFATVTAGLDVEGVTGTISETGLLLSGGGQVSFDIEPAFASVEARYTYLSVDTQQLQQIPGIEVEDDQRLDGLLVSVGVGFMF